MTTPVGRVVGSIGVCIGASVLAVVATAGAATTDASTTDASTTAAASGGTATASEAAASGAITNPTRHVLAYVTETAADAVAVLDTQASPPSVVGTIGLGATCHPQGITASPTRSWVVVDCAGRTPLKLTTTTTAHGGVDVIDTSTNAVVHTLALAGDPIASAFSSDGKTLYVLSYAGPTQGASVGSKFVIDVLHATSGALNLSSSVALPGTQWVNPEAIGAIAVGDGGARVAVGTSGTATVTPKSGAVDVYTVATGKLSTPPHQYAFSGLAPWALSFNPAHPSVLYVSPGSRTPGTRKAITVITVVATSGSTPTSQFSWSNVTVLPDRAGQIVVSPNGTTFAVTLTVDGTTYVGPLAVTASTAKVLHAVTVPGATPKAVDWVYLNPATGFTPMGAALLPGGTRLYVVMAGYTTRKTATTSVGSQVVVLDAVTSVVTRVPLPPSTHAAGVAFGQPPAPAPPTTTTTTTVPPTTTTVPPTTTTVPVTTTTVPTGPQLAYTGEDVAPWASLGGSLVVAGLLLLLVDLRRRAPGRHRLP